MFMRTLSFSIVLFGAALLWFTPVGHTEYLPSDSAPAIERMMATEAAPLSPQDQLRATAREAYMWGWPLVYMHNCRRSFERTPMIGRSGGMPVAPVNELCMLTDFIQPKLNNIACPNQDVVYGFGVFDLDRDAVVVQVPDFGDRFWLFQMGDQRTDGFAEVGKMYGTKPGMYLVVGPNWNGTVPPGIAGVWHCPTRTGFCLPRVFLADTAADRAALQPVINGIMAYPLAAYTGAMKTYDWSKTRWLPRFSNGGSQRSKWVVPESFFDDLSEVLIEVSPLAGEEALYDRLRAMTALAKTDAAVMDLIVQTAVETEAELVAPLFEFRNFGTRLAHNWTTIANGAAFGTDYLTRTAVAKSNIFVNRNTEAKYYYQDLDNAGLRLNGSRGYAITFAAGQLPPTRGFWSLTLYDGEHKFHQNELDRHSLGTKNDTLKYNADGSLTIYVQSTPPSDELRSNWLPAPTGEFSLYLRAYWPEVAATSGAWTPPPVVAAVDQVAGR